MPTNLLRAYVILREFLYSRLLVQRETAQLKNNFSAILKQGKIGYRSKLEDLGLELTKLRHVLNHTSEKERDIIGVFDRDGCLLSRVGDIPDFSLVNEEHFSPPTRNTLHLVNCDGCVGVRKTFRNNNWAFINETRIYHRLSHAGANVPAILSVDFDSSTLITSYVIGTNLQDALAKKGAVVRHRDIHKNPDLATLKKNELVCKFNDEGRCIVMDIVSQQFVEEIMEQIEIIHSIGVIWSDAKYGNIVIEKKTGMPYLLDFEHARYYPELSRPLFRRLCERDNRIIRTMFCID